MIIGYIATMKTALRTSGAARSAENLARVAQMLKLLAHPHRLRIVEILEADEAPVHAIVDHLGLPQGATSQHLNQMRRVGLVAAERRGKEVWYGIADRRAIRILRCVCERNRP